MDHTNPLDTIVDRRNSDSVKYGAGNRSPEKEKLLPLWVADMDFRVPEPVIEALHRRTEHGIFGYGAPEADYYDAVCSWFRNHFDFEPNPRWIVPTPGVVFALSTAIRTFTEKGDAVLINRPVYYPFSLLIDGLERRLVNSPLRLNNGRYEIDFEDMEEKIVNNNVRLYLLCSPHNPVGRVWTREELKKVGDICRKHGVLVVADEIHCDFVWSDHPHTVYASLGEEYRSSCILCTAPSKTFNLAGLNTSNIIIPDADLRRRFRKTITDIGASSMNVMGLTACRAAYEKGLPWLTDVRKYIRENIDFAVSYIRQNIPEIGLIPPEGTYLLWLDMHALGFSEEELERFITEDAGLWLDAGSIFGPEGEGFQRINIACPRSVLTDALNRLSRAVRRR